MAAFFAHGAAAPTEGIRLRGVLSDPAFPPPGPYRLELLETGDTLQVSPGTPFSLRLPPDTIWTLCLRRVDSAGAYEKCYEARRPGSDTAFSARLEGEGMVVAEPDTAAVAEAPADTSEILDEAPAGGAETGVLQLKKVVLRAQRLPKRSMGREVVSAKLIKRLPSLAEADVIRSIQGLPGVVSSSDFSTKIYVRGGGSDQNLILFDNAPVYSPVHFFGLFSTFLVEGVKDVTFYKGGFPPEYGNRLSSVLDIQSRRGGKDTADSWFQGSSVKISTVASQAHTEGRQGPMRWLLAGRTTYIRQVVDFLRERGLLDLTLDYYFYDVQGNVAYAPGGDTEAMLSLYQGRDRLNFDPFGVEWGNTVVPFNFRWKPAENWSSKTSLSYSLLSQSFGLESIFEFYNRIASYSGKQSFEYSGIDGHRLTFGGQVDWSRVIFRNTQSVARITLRDDTPFFLSSLHAQDKWTLEPWELSPGLRLNYMSTLETPQAEPRFSAKRTLPERQALDFHVGYYFQYINSIIFADQESINEFYYPAKKVKFRTVHPTSSWLFAAGYSKEGWLDRFDLSLEAYYKTLHRLLIFAPNEKPDSVLLNTGRDLGDLFSEAEGYSLGAEVSFRKPAGLMFGGLSYSHGYSVIREENFRDPYFPKWHQPHSFKGDLALNWTGSEAIWPAGLGYYFRSSTQVKFASGLPYTSYEGYSPGHLVDQNRGREGGGPNPEFNRNLHLVRGQYNASFVPSYFRWDVKPVDWGREGKWNFSLTLLNVTNNDNVFFYTYDRDQNPPQRVTVSQFPFFPFLVNYEYYF